jgi:hypothetical protein
MKYPIIIFIFLVSSSVCLKSQDLASGFANLKFGATPATEEKNPVTVNKKPSCNTYLLENQNLVSISPAQIYSFAQIEFTVPEKSNISIGIFDLNGLKIMNIVSSSTFEEGTYKKTITSKKLKKGIYYVTLEMENYKETKQITVTR